MNRNGSWALALTLSLLGTPGWALDSKVDLVVENWGREFAPIVDCVEYQQQWNGEMGTSVFTGWTWDRVGFRVTDQSSPQPGIAPIIEGYGVTYGDFTIRSEAGALQGFAVAVEDPRKPYLGYYGRLAGTGPDGSYFEGTLRFAEEDDGALHGEVDLVVNGGPQGDVREVYFQPIAIKGEQVSGQTVEYVDAQPVDVYHEMMLHGQATGTMSGPVDVTMDAVRLRSGPYPMLDLAWAFMRRADGWAVGEADPPPDPSGIPGHIGDGSLWMGIQQTLMVDPPQDAYAGMFLSYAQHADTRLPAFTIEGAYSFLSGHFLGKTEHLFGIPGDLNGDRKVDSTDLDMVRANWSEQTLAGEYLQADCSRDGRVGSRDLDMVRAHWGGPYVTPVPEPAALALLGAFVAVSLVRRIRRP